MLHARRFEWNSTLTITSGEGGCPYFAKSAIVRLSAAGVHVRKEIQVNINNSGNYFTDDDVDRVLDVVQAQGRGWLFVQIM